MSSPLEYETKTQNAYIFWLNRIYNKTGTFHGRAESISMMKFLSASWTHHLPKQFSAYSFLVIGSMGGIHHKVDHMFPRDLSYRKAILVKGSDSL